MDGSETLTEDMTAQEQANYRKKSQKALSAIVMAVSPSQLYLITSCDSPKKAWDALRSHFERDTLANKLLLKKKILSYGDKGVVICGSSPERHEGADG